jgi:hypothetical protein
VAELAGHRHGTCSRRDAAHLALPEGAQDSATRPVLQRHSKRTAAPRNSRRSCPGNPRRSSGSTAPRGAPTAPGAPCPVRPPARRRRVAPLPSRRRPVASAAAGPRRACRRRPAAPASATALRRQNRPRARLTWNRRSAARCP